MNSRLDEMVLPEWWQFAASVKNWFQRVQAQITGRPIEVVSASTTVDISIRLEQVKLMSDAEITAHFQTLYSALKETYGQDDKAEHRLEIFKLVIQFIYDVRDIGRSNVICEASKKLGLDLK